MTDQQIMVYTGQAMLWLLIVILAARPVHKYLKFKYLMKFRRHLGWAISIVALAHFSYWVAYYLSISNLLKSLGTLWLSAGLFSFSILMVLGATSNTWSVKKLGGTKWKKLHKWTYLLPILSLVHAHYAVRGINWDLILYAIPLMLLLSWRFKETLSLAIGLSILLAAVYVGYSNHNLEQVVSTNDFEETFNCPRFHDESVSCGWPVYLSDGTRILGSTGGWERTHQGSWRQVEP